MYKHIILGGTFDGLHKGHVHFLTGAFAAGGQVTIGLTSEAYIKRFKKGLGVAPFSKRYQALTSWLRKKGLAERARIIPIDNKWGGAVLGDGFDAIAVTGDNRHTAIEINEVRVERGLPRLSLVEIDLIEADGRQEPGEEREKGEISATRDS